MTTADAALLEAAQPQIDWKNPDYTAIWRQRIEMARRLAELTDDELQALKAYYQANPADFISHWGVTFDPRMKERGLPTTMPFVLFPKQREAVEWIVARWKGREDGLIEKSRDMGISWVTVGVAVWMWALFDGTVIGFGSRKEDYVDKIGDPDSLFWKLRSFVRTLPPRLRPRLYDERKHAPFMRLINPDNGSVVGGEAGDNIGRGARASIYFLDEAAFIEHPEATDASLSQTTNCQIHLSTPNGEGNPFWQKRHGGRWPVFVFDWKDDPRKDQAWYEAQKRKKTPVIVAQEIDRDYSAAVSNSFIPSSLVIAAQARGPADVAAVGPIRMGLDVARFGDDKTVLTIRRGRVLVKQTAWNKTDLMSTAARVHQEILAYERSGAEVQQVAVDVIGVGAGVADRLREWHPKIVEDVNSADLMDDGQNYNLRAYMWAEMKEWLETVVVLPNDQELRADITGLRYLYKAGLLLIESKDDAKKRGLKSPNRADSLALTFARPGARKRRVRADAAVYEVHSETGI